tara:strand:+ start:403 stop:717 length:315 start_codon:yes stop_codon:yes gene_type:complete
MDFKSVIREFLDGGWVIPVIGAAGMIVRMLTYKGRVSLKDFLRNVLAAAILSGILWFVLHDAPISDFLKAISYGIVGVVSPEITNGLIALAKKFEKNPDKFLKK